MFVIEARYTTTTRRRRRRSGASPLLFLLLLLLILVVVALFYLYKWRQKKQRLAASSQSNVGYYQEQQKVQGGQGYNQAYNQQGQNYQSREIDELKEVVHTDEGNNFGTSGYQPPTGPPPAKLYDV